MDPILESFQSTAQAIAFKVPRIPVISPLLKDVIRDGETFGLTYLSRHCRETVNFLGSLEIAEREGTVDGTTLFFEVGPHPVCSHMVKSTLGSQVVTLTSLRRNENPWKTTATTLCALYPAGVSIDWAEYHGDFNDSQDLPTYAFDEKVYWIDYRNEWCLTKGDPSRLSQNAVEVNPQLSTAGIQKIVHEEVQENTALLVAQSDLAEPLLHAAMCGHLVNGAGLCPSSAYADMAYTLSDYAYRLLRPDAKDIGMNVSSMEAFRPLVVKNIRKSERQIIQVEAFVDLNLSKANISFHSLSSDGSIKTDHARCMVDFGAASKWTSEWQKQAYLIQTRVELLERKMQEGSAHKILRGMAYKLFAALVQYDDKFQGMKEVILDSEQLEATAIIAFRTGPGDTNGRFFICPYFIDSVAHLSGFIMNANDAVDSRNQVYISHGWNSMRFAKPLCADTTYRTYVKVCKDPNPLSSTHLVLENLLDAISRR